MRAVLTGVAAVGLAGAGFTHFGDGPDYRREVAKSPSAVYSAFSSLAEQGETSQEAAGPGGATVTQRVKKVSGKSIVIEALVGGKSAIRMEVDFAAAKGGAATNLTAEAQVDPAVLSTVDPDLGRAFSAMPTAVVDVAFAKWMEANVRRIEAGMPLDNFDLSSGGFGSSVGANSPSAAVDQRRWEAEDAQRRAAAPSASAEPMVDPNEAAREYMHGHSSY